MSDELENNLETPALEANVVRHIRSVKYENLPPEAIVGTKKAILWFLGTAIAGSAAVGSDLILEFSETLGIAGRSQILGSEEVGSAERAAFANACFAKAHEYEDKYWVDNTGGFAIGYAVVAAALAVAEEAGGVSGRDFLTAVAVAIDLQARLLSAPQTDLSPAVTGWNSTYLFATYGAAVAVGKILRMSETQLEDMLGLCHCQAAGNFQGHVEGVLGIRVQAGFSVRNAIASARLAKLGASGVRSFLSGRFGLYSLHFPGQPVDLGTISRGLGTTFLGANLGFKAYPCGVVAHPVIDAIRTLETSARADEVVAVRVLGTPRLSVMTEPRESRWSPRTTIEAQFSLPWAVACALMDGGLGLRHFTTEVLHDRDYRGLAELVSVDLDPSREAVTVEVEFKDGSMSRSDPVKYGRGHPENPLSLPEIIEVYRETARYGQSVPSNSAIEGVLSAVLELEGLDDVRALGSVWTRSESPALT